MKLCLKLGEKEERYYFLFSFSMKSEFHPAIVLLHAITSVPHHMFDVFFHIFFCNEIENLKQINQNKLSNDRYIYQPDRID